MGDASELDQAPRLSPAETVRYRGEIGGVRRVQRITGLAAVLGCGIALFWLLDNWSLGHSLYHAVFSIASVAACLGVGVWQGARLVRRPPREPMARVVEGTVRVDVDPDDDSTDVWVGEYRVVPPPHWRGALRSGQVARVRIAAAPGSSHAVLLAIDGGRSADAEAQRGLGAYPHGNPAAPWTLAVAAPVLVLCLLTVAAGLAGTGLGAAEAGAAWSASWRPLVSTSKTPDAAKILAADGQVQVEGAAKLPRHLVSRDGLVPPFDIEWVILHDHARDRELETRSNPAFAKETPAVVLHEGDTLAYLRSAGPVDKPKSRGTGDEVVRWLKQTETLRLVRLPGDDATPPSLWNPERVDSLARSVMSAIAALFSAIVVVWSTYSWRRTTVLRRRFDGSP